MNITAMVHRYYWEDDINCATTALKTLSELFEIDLHPQVVDAAIGMHGAGGFGAQCGLVEGSLMFIGIWGRAQARDEESVANACHRFAADFQAKFGSLICSQLRPEGFKSDNPPHLCEELTKKAIAFTAEFIGSIK